MRKLNKYNFKHFYKAPDEMSKSPNGRLQPGTAATPSQENLNKDLRRVTSPEKLDKEPTKDDANEEEEEKEDDKYKEEIIINKCFEILGRHIQNAELNLRALYLNRC